MHIPSRKLIARLVMVVAIGVVMALQGASANARSVTTPRTSVSFPGACHDMPAVPKTYHGG